MLFWNGALNVKVCFVLKAALARIAVRCGVLFVLGMLEGVELLPGYV